MEEGVFMFMYSLSQIVLFGGILVSVHVFVWVGLYLDKKLNKNGKDSDIPGFIALFVMFALIAIIYVGCCYLSPEFAKEHIKEWVLDALRLN